MRKASSVGECVADVTIGIVIVSDDSGSGCQATIPRHFRHQTVTEWSRNGGWLSVRTGEYNPCICIELESAEFSPALLRHHPAGRARRSTDRCAGRVRRAVAERSLAERLPLRAMRSDGCRFPFFACCSAFSAPPRSLCDQFSGLFVAAPRKTRAAYGAHGAVELIAPRRRERRGAPPKPAGPGHLRDVPLGSIAQKSAQNSALLRSAHSGQIKDWSAGDVTYLETMSALPWGLAGA